MAVGKVFYIFIYNFFKRLTHSEVMRYYAFQVHITSLLEAVLAAYVLRVKVVREGEGQRKLVRGVLHEKQEVVVVVKLDLVALGYET